MPIHYSKEELLSRFSELIRRLKKDPTIDLDEFAEDLESLLDDLNYFL